jgi:hypothetical protein
MKFFKLFAALAIPGLLLVPTSASASQATGSAAFSRHLLAAKSVDLFGPATRAKAAPLVIGNHPVRRATTAAGTGTAQAISLGAAQIAASVAFPMTSLDDQVSAFGTDQAVEPPDTMLAAGPASLLETINSTASTWSKTGSRQAFADLNQVLPLPSGFVFSDPRILYDAASGRFFFAGLGFTPLYNSVVIVGVSKTSDPRSGFFFYQLAQTSNRELHDQPKIGVNDDKVVISWNDFCCGLIPLFIGAETWILQKSSMLAGTSANGVATGPTLTQSSPVPAQSLSATTTEYVSYNGGSYTGVLAINGTPDQGNVTITDTHVGMPSTSQPPNALQPGGTIATNDDRFTSAVWRNGQLWTSGNTGCVPEASATKRSCLRLVDIATAGTPTLVHAFDLGQNGVDAYYPAVTLDAAGDAFFSLTVSGSNLFPSAAAGEIKAGAFAGASIYLAGKQTYGGTRWGDYSAISVDPANGSVWAGAEYSAVGSSKDWGTAAGQFTP